jgi:hypothetical protein
MMWKCEMLACWEKLGVGLLVGTDYIVVYDDKREVDADTNDVLL